MSDLNAVYLQGRLTKDASMNTTSSGGCVVTLSLASNKDYLDRNSNEWVKQTHFFDVSYWGESARKNLAEYTRGREVLVEAELKTSTWEKDGKKYSRIEIRASRVRPLRRPGEGKRIGGCTGGGNYQQGYTQAPPPAPDFDGETDAAAAEYPDSVPF